MENQQKPDETVKHDEDVKFERDKESLITPLTSEENAQSAKNSPEESAIPAKEDTMGKSNFPPLTELDKQPKLPGEEERIEERIKEMNQRTSMDD